MNSKKSASNLIKSPALLYGAEKSAFSGKNLYQENAVQINTRHFKHSLNP